MKMIDLLAAATLAFLCAVLSVKLANDIAGMHADALHRLQAVGDAAVLVSAFREQTATGKTPPDFPEGLPTGLRGITELRRTAAVDERGKQRYTLHFLLLGSACTVRSGGDE